MVIRSHGYTNYYVQLEGSKTEQWKVAATASSTFINKKGEHCPTQTFKNPVSDPPLFPIQHNHWFKILRLKE